MRTGWAGNIGNCSALVGWLTCWPYSGHSEWKLVDDFEVLEPTRGCSAVNPSGISQNKAMEQLRVRIGHVMLYSQFGNPKESYRIMPNGWRHWPEGEDRRTTYLLIAPTENGTITLHEKNALAQTRLQPQCVIIKREKIFCIFMRDELTHSRFHKFESALIGYGMEGIRWR